METSLRWKIPAASAAEQRVLLKTCVKCSGEPAPLLAMTGMFTASLTALSQLQVKALTDAVHVYTVEEDLPRSERLHRLC